MNGMTCFSDAAFCAQTQSCGWGGWAICDLWGSRRFYGGIVTSHLLNANEAELAAMAALLTRLSQNSELHGIRRIVLQSDSIAALSALYSVDKAAIWSGSGHHKDVAQPQRRITMSPFERRTAKDIRSVVEDRVLVLRHVKGHSKIDTGRKWVNAQCDAEARRQMQQRRRSQSARQWVDA